MCQKRILISIFRQKLRNSKITLYRQAKLVSLLKHGPGGWETLWGCIFFTFYTKRSVLGSKTSDLFSNDFDVYLIREGQLTPHFGASQVCMNSFYPRVRILKLYNVRNLCDIKLNFFLNDPQLPNKLPAKYLLVPVYGQELWSNL